MTRLSEAARLEQALQEADKKETNVNEFLRECVEGYRLAYPEQSFELNTLDKKLSLNLNKDLFFQMLDKLISNAVDFSSKGKNIIINLLEKNDAIELQVINSGPTLPVDMLDELFNSMISVRNERSEAGPHLGLGLFVAKLIAEYHGGKISASNLANEEGVCLSITLQK